MNKFRGDDKQLAFEISAKTVLFANQFYAWFVINFWIKLRIIFIFYTFHFLKHIQQEP